MLPLAGVCICRGLCGEAAVGLDQTHSFTLCNACVNLVCLDNNVQLARFDGSGLSCNAEMDPAHIREYCELHDTSKALMRSAMNQLGMSAQASHRVLKLVWMIIVPFVIQPDDAI